MTLRLAQEEGVFAGVSTGANVVGALRLADRLGPDAVIVTLAVDSGFKYMSAAPYHTLGDVPSGESESAATVS
jgi:cysteine synthase A